MTGTIEGGGRLTRKILSLQGLYAGTTVIDVQLIGQYKGLANDFTDNSERATLSPESEEYQLRLVECPRGLTGYMP